MTKVEHDAEAERLSRHAEENVLTRSGDFVTNIVAMAHVHAMLAGDYRSERWG